MSLDLVTTTTTATTTAATTTTTTTATTPTTTTTSLAILPSWTSDSCSSYHGDCLRFRVGLSHDNFTLIESSDFSLLRGTITGLVGTNGAGKTSLAKVIASKELPGFPKDRLTIQYVSSHENCDKRHDYNDSWSKNNANDLTPEAYLHLTVQERIDVLQAEIDTLENSMDGQDDEQVEEMANGLAELYEVQDDVKESLEREIQQILTALGFGPHLKKKVSQLSLGWQYKCRLAAAFTLLTNHPFSTMRRWIGSFRKPSKWPSLEISWSSLFLTRKPSWKNYAIECCI
jgi:ABC-type branched-subunit amino acid transport system ATPase component